MHSKIPYLGGVRRGEVRRGAEGGVRREKCDAASELAANTFVIFAGKRRLIAAKLHSFVTQM